MNLKAHIPINLPNLIIEEVSTHMVYRSELDATTVVEVNDELKVGEEFDYNRMVYNLVGNIMCELQGVPYEDFVKQESLLLLKVEDITYSENSSFISMPAHK